MVALELAKQLKPQKTIIISSITDAFDLPFYFHLAIHKILPARVLKRINFLAYYFFGVQDEKEKVLLKSIIKETDEKFLKWAIHQLLHWKRRTDGNNLIHIHGTADKILPFPK